LPDGVEDVEDLDYEIETEEVVSSSVAAWTADSPRAEELAAESDPLLWNVETRKVPTSKINIVGIN